MSCMMLGRVLRDESLGWRQRFPLRARDGRLGRCFQASEHPNSRGPHSSTSETESSWRNYHAIHSGLRRGVMLRMYRKRVTWGSLWT